jgi:hypothetical protein
MSGAALTTPRPTIRTLRIDGPGLFQFLKAASRGEVRITSDGIPPGASLAGTPRLLDDGTIELDIVWHAWPPEHRTDPLHPHYVTRVGNAGIATDWSAHHPLTPGHP